jgi:membrane-bound ClpP family serine protease
MMDLLMRGLKCASLILIIGGFIITIFNAIIPMRSSNPDMTMCFVWLSIGVIVVLLGLCLDYQRLACENHTLKRKLIGTIPIQI